MRLHATFIYRDILIEIPLQVHLKEFEYLKKGQYILSLISESETQILYRLITHRVYYLNPLFHEILMIMAYR